MRFLLTSSLVGLLTQVIVKATNEHIRFAPLPGVTKDSLHNIHIEYGAKEFSGDLQIMYGDCDIVATHPSHQLIGRTEVESKSRPERFVWIVPKDARSHQCLHAFSGSEHIGRSTPIAIHNKVVKRQTIADVADISGPWFEGVAYMKSKNNSHAFVTAAKNKSTYPDTALYVLPTSV